MSVLTSVFACLVVLVVGASASTPNSTVGITAVKCDQTWKSSQNQTFAYLGVGGPYVQLKGYWGGGDGCLGTVGIGNASTLQFSSYECSLGSSLWTYGPGSVKEPVYFVSVGANATGTVPQCISLVWNASSNSTANTGLVLKDCCHLKEAASRRGTARGRTFNADRCTKDEAVRQLWYEAPTTKNPYNRIRSILTAGRLAPDGFCFTRTL